MTAFPMPAEDSDGVPASLQDIAAPPALLRLPKYYQVKRQLLDFTAAMAPGSPVPPCIHRAPETHPGDPPRLLLIS